MTEQIKITSFTTHENVTVKGKELQEALNAVADDWKNLAIAIRKEDDYGPSVPDSYKDDYLEASLKDAELIRDGYVSSFTIKQRINTYLTGKCIPLLS